jgi:hypothetical protein
MRVAHVKEGGNGGTLGSLCWYTAFSRRGGNYKPSRCQIVVVSPA